MLVPVSRASFLVLAALLAGCAGAAGGRPPSGAGAVPDYEAIFRARADSAQMRFSEADIRFVTGMMHHHAQALEMASLAPTHGASPTIRTLAARVLNGQRDEIASMERWLRDRGQPAPEVGADADGMSAMMHASHMPGMLTQEQMEELEQARGAEFDRLFLTFMIQHHRGAVQAVQELFSTEGALQDEELFRLASDIQVDQNTEIARMERILAAMTPFGGTR